MIYMALGRRELGKTTLVYSMAVKCPYRVILDPRGLIHSARGVRATSFGQAQTLIETMMLDDVDTPATEKFSEVIVTPENDLQETFDAISDSVKAWCIESDQPLMFVVDEARFFDLRASASFEYVLRAAPRDRVHVAITAHRPADIPTDVRAISDHWLMFRCTQEHDLKVIEERCTSSVRETVSNLKPHEFVHWNDATATARVFKDPSEWYVPLSQAPARVKAPRMLPDGLELVVDKGTLF